MQTEHYIVNLPSFSVWIFSIDIIEVFHNNITCFDLRIIALTMQCWCTKFSPMSLIRYILFGNIDVGDTTKTHSKTSFSGLQHPKNQ